MWNVNFHSSFNVRNNLKNSLLQAHALGVAGYCSWPIENIIEVEGLGKYLVRLDACFFALVGHLLGIVLLRVIATLCLEIKGA